MVVAINGRTLDLWLDYWEAQLERCEAGQDGLGRAIGAYFEFALVHRHV
ncbi:hypothetical protein OMW55_02565 [Sphingomonas sp. BN140010]|uniref:Uncharacterized protein n=1 Tax=Sphingomonas arvum TaxID=2992113 RepID=A0ABT3JD43_9SPHN|nr:hypothetical protein [Sphingomonas sp. BN140010]MCW3796690.1 hypothetical protein [Sphingomonas sp. BN140010]